MITRELIERNDREISRERIEKMALDTSYKLANFVTKNTREAPCLLNASTQTLGRNNE